MEEAQGGCELRSEAFVKIQEKKNFGGGGGGGGDRGGGGVRLGGCEWRCEWRSEALVDVNGGCEWRSEAFVKIQKKKIFFFLEGGGGRGLGSRGGGVRVDGNREVKLV